MKYNQIYRGSYGVTSGYRARKGVAKRLKSHVNRRIGKATIKYELEKA